MGGLTILLQACTPKLSQYFGTKRATLVETQDRWRCQIEIDRNNANFDCDCQAAPIRKRKRSAHIVGPKGQSPRPRGCTDNIRRFNRLRDILCTASKAHEEELAAAPPWHNANMARPHEPGAWPSPKLAFDIGQPTKSIVSALTTPGEKARDFRVPTCGLASAHQGRTTRRARAHTWGMAATAPHRSKHRGRQPFRHRSGCFLHACGRRREAHCPFKHRNFGTRRCHKLRTTSRMARPQASQDRSGPPVRASLVGTPESNTHHAGLRFANLASRGGPTSNVSTIS